MEGRAVFKHAVAMITDVIEQAFKATGYTADDVDWFVPHQANKRIIDDSARKLGIAPEGGHHRGQARQYLGGLDSAALTVAVADGRIKRGDLVMLEAMGGGLHLGGDAAAVVSPMLKSSHHAPLTARSDRISSDNSERYLDRRRRGWR
jgi:3-oxoacyl-[acyl-carrier-protein] synthase III